MKKIIALFLLFFITTNVSSQIGKTKSELIQENKNNMVSEEVTENGTEYIKYKIEYENYTSHVACYLTEKEESEEQQCYGVLFLEPKSEANAWVKYFNDKNFVKLKGMKWKDYENNTLYELEVKEELCKVYKGFDLDN